jgi:catechol 2,3-dioxygenase-like lactoylglutathione lyase family enzyme
MFARSKLVPELMVTDIHKSLHFWTSLIGFNIAYERPEVGFAYLDQSGVQLMLEQYDPAKTNGFPVRWRHRWGAASIFRSPSIQSNQFSSGWPKFNGRCFVLAPMSGIARMRSKSASVSFWFRIRTDTWFGWWKVLGNDHV